MGKEGQVNSFDAFRFQISSRRRHCFIGILLRCAFTSGWNAVNAYRPRAYSVTRLLLTTTLVRLGGGESQVWRTQRDAESSNTKHETIEKRYLIDCDRWTRILDRICEIEDDDTSRQLLLHPDRFARRFNAIRSTGNLEG